MKKVLTQEEIDSLISAISSGELIDETEVDEKLTSKAKNYDFKRPNKLSKDHIHSIENIYENYARITSNILSVYLRTTIELKIGSIEQLSYGEFIKSIPNPTILAIFKLEPFRGPILMEGNPSLGFQFINYLCGGVEEDHSELRSFTDIEMVLLEDVFSIIIESNAVVWKDIIEITPKFEKIETNTQLNQTLSYNESVVLLTMKITIGSYQNIINLCIPYRALDLVIDKLHSNNFNIVNGNNEELYKTEIEEMISESPLNVEVLLGKTSITVDDFLNLQEGDVLALTNSVEDVLELYIENDLYFHVQPGLSNKKMSVQIVGDAGRIVN